MKRVFFLAVFLWVPLLLIAQASAPELQMTEIKANGHLILTTGQEIKLAGLLIPSETVPLLKALLNGKPFELEYEAADASGVPVVYLYLQMKELQLPGKKKSENKRRLINEFLLERGAASVDSESAFKHKERFLKIEAQAREKGEGIWSYDPVLGGGKK